MHHQLLEGGDGMTQNASSPAQATVRHMAYAGASTKLCNRSNLRWAHRKERARAVTAVFGSLDVGSAVGLLVCGPLIHAFGWPSVFYLFAALGLVWSAAWPLLKPEQADPDVPAPPPSSSPSVSGTLLTEGGQRP